MNIDQQNELQSFHAFVAEQLENGGVDLSPEEVLALWRERVDTIAAVNEGLKAVHEGRTKPLDQFRSDFESRNNSAVE